MKHENFNISRKLHGNTAEAIRPITFIKKLIILKNKYHFNVYSVSSYTNNKRVYRWGTFDISLTSDILVVSDIKKIKQELGFEINSAVALDGKIFILIKERYDIR